MKNRLLVLGSLVGLVTCGLQADPAQRLQPKWNNGQFAERIKDKKAEKPAKADRKADKHVKAEKKDRPEKAKKTRDLVVEAVVETQVEESVQPAE